MSEDEIEKLIDELIKNLYWSEPYSHHNRLEIAGLILKVVGKCSKDSEQI